MASAHQKSKSASRTKLQDLDEVDSTIPLRVDRLEFYDLRDSSRQRQPRLRAHVLKRIVSSERSRLSRARTYPEVLEAVRALESALANFEAIKEARVEIGAAEGDKCVVRVGVAERRYSASVNLASARSDGAGESRTSLPVLQASGALKNLSGCADDLSLQVSVPSRPGGTLDLASPSFRLEYTNPFPRPHLARLVESYGASASSRNEETGDYVRTRRQTSLEVEARLPGSLGLLRYVLAWREAQAAPDAPLSMRQEMGHSLKSSLAHVLSAHRELWRGRVLLRAQQHAEVAGLGGDVRFLRWRAVAEAAAALGLRGLWLEWGLQAGLLRPLAGDRSRLQDRFELAGSSRLRGFEERGVGLGARGEPLGGDLYWLSSLRLNAPLPPPPRPLQTARAPFLRDLFAAWHSAVTGSPFGLHAFLDAGNLVRYANAERPELKPALAALFRQVRLVGGLGLVLRVGPLQVEFNWCRPLRREPLDRVLRWQIGFSLRD